jgi:hypothetical protein
MPTAPKPRNHTPVRRRTSFVSNQKPKPFLAPPPSAPQPPATQTFQIHFQVLGFVPSNSSNSPTKDAGSLPILRPITHRPQPKFYNHILQAAISLAKPVSRSEPGVPWYVWCSLAAITSCMIGVHWDISWHQSIGRDTFWTPAHLAIHLCGILAGVASSYLILSTTFNPYSPLRKTSVRMWGFYGPLGAFIMAWGGLCMIVSAPFDDWWHRAYGLDVKILSPPHAALALGIFGVHAGVLVLILAYMNRARAHLRGWYLMLFLYVGGILLVALTAFQMEITARPMMHTVYFYRVLALTVPLVLPRVSRATGYKWAATSVAAVYTVILFLIGRILPLFPAEPKLGPVYQHVTQFVPPEFPILLIAPAFVLDLLWQRTAHWGLWKQSFVSGAVFLIALAAVQWPFAYFLMSPWARNWLFGTKYLAYFQRPGSLYLRYAFLPFEHGWPLLRESALALAIATFTTWLGLVGGDRMRQVRR